MSVIHVWAEDDRRVPACSQVPRENLGERVGGADQPLREQGCLGIVAPVTVLAEHDLARLVLGYVAPFECVADGCLYLLTVRKQVSKEGLVVADVEGAEDGGGL